VQYQNGATNTTSPNPAFAGNVQGICPSGWHIPSLAELQTLDSTVNKNGNALKAVGQGSIDQYSDGRGTNTSGFSALLAGGRYYHTTDSAFHYLDLGSSTSFRSSMYDFTIYAWFMFLGDNFSDVYLYEYGKVYGFSVRCLKD
jgi:uncharacterized protein (TIGR02145 family)